MNELKLTPEQIEELHEFCIYRSIWHYDVQVELVDHLASAIEEHWKTNPKLSFQDALYEVDQKFGSHAGFVIIRQEKEKALRKKYRRLLWRFVADYYKFPKIMITLSLLLGIFTVLQVTKNDQWIVGSLLIFSWLFSMFYVFYHFPQKIKIKVVEGHQFMLNEIGRVGLASKTMLLLNGSLYAIIRYPGNFSTTGSLVFSALISLYLVLLYGDCFFIPKKIHEHFKEQFPQFKFA
jgi:hypothetical protein